MHPNVELMQKGYEAFSKGDMETIDALMADDIVWHSPGSHPLAGTYKGKQEVFGLFGNLMEQSGGTFTVQTHAVLADATHAVALVNVSASREGKTLSANDVQVFHVVDGRITEQWLFPGDQVEQDAFWS